MRITANQIVRQDQQLLASDYPDDFLRSTAGTKNTDLLYGALQNLLQTGRGKDGYEHIHALLKSPHRWQRDQAATLISASALMEWKSRKQLSASFWSVLDAVLADDAGSIRRAGPILILLLIGEDAPVPASYISPVVEAGLAAQDPADLAVSCIVVSRLSRGSFVVPIFREARTKAAILKWFQQNAEAARRELKLWHATWKSQDVKID